MAGISNNIKGKTANFFEAFSPFLCLKYRGLDNQNCLIPVIPPTGLPGSFVDMTLSVKEFEWGFKGAC